jgi:hypothetical protein
MSFCDISKLFAPLPMGTTAIEPLKSGRKTPAARGFLQWSQIESLTEDRTRSHVHRFKIFLHPGRQPQKMLSDPTSTERERMFTSALRPTAVAAFISVQN